MSGPLGELERRLALPGADIIRIRAPPNSCMIWPLIAGVEQRGTGRIWTRMHHNWPSIKFRELDTIITVDECEPCDARPAMVLFDCDQVEGNYLRWCGQPSAISDKILLFWDPWVPGQPPLNCTEIRGKIVVVGTGIMPKPNDIELPGYGPWSWRGHRGLPRYSRRWFHNVFLILCRYAVLAPSGAPDNISVEVIEAILTKLSSAAF